MCVNTDKSITKYNNKLSTHGCVCREAVKLVLMVQINLTNITQPGLQCIVCLCGSAI